MHSQKNFIMAITCAIALTAAPLVAAENIASYSTVPGNLLLAQGHEQHAVNKGDHAKKATDGHAGHRKHWQRHKMEAKSYADMIASHADELGLSDEQLGKIIRLRLKSVKQNREIMHQAYKNMKALRKASLRPDADDNTLRKYAKEHADAINNLTEQHISQRQAIHGILTEEQLKKLKTMKMDHGDHDSHGANKKSGHDA